MVATTSMINEMLQIEDISDYIYDINELLKKPEQKTAQQSLGSLKYIYT